MKRLIDIVVTVVFISTLIYSNVNSTGWIVFKKIQSPKPKPLTIASTLSYDLSGMLYNPSIIGIVKDKEIFMLGELGLVQDVVSGLLYAHPFNNQGISFGILNYNVGKEKLYYIEGTEEQEQEVTIQNDIVGLVSYGRFIREKLSLGAAIKFGISNIAELKTAYAYALDIGVLYYFKRTVSMSLAIQNLGTTTKFVDRQEQLPTLVLLGAGFTQSFINNYFLNVSCDIPYIFEEKKLAPSVGLEFGRLPVSIFLGYSSQVEESFFTIGINLNIRQFRLMYSFTPSVNLSNINRLSFSVRF